MPVSKIVIIIVILLFATFSVRVLYAFTNFNALFSKVGSINKTRECDLIEINSLMCTKKGKPFTGTSILRGEELFLSPYKHGVRDGKEIPMYEDGKRTTQYKNGLKDGVQMLYFTYHSSVFGQMGGPKVYYTLLYSQTQYKQGLKHGAEIENYHSTPFRHTEYLYENGKLHGISKEYEYIHANHIDQRVISETIGPLILEAEYKNGVLSGIYRTYGETGGIDEDYITENGKIISGRKKVVYNGSELPADRQYIHSDDESPESLTGWDFYENGELVKQVFYVGRYVGATRYPPEAPLAFEAFYENGTMVEDRKYKTDWGKKCFVVVRQRKMYHGELIEVFNSKTGVNRLEEFGIESDEDNL